MPETKQETCGVCFSHPSDRPMGSMYKDVPEDVKLVAKYCVENTRRNHVVTAVWKECCGEFDHYSVDVNPETWGLYRKNKEENMRKGG